MEDCIKKIVLREEKNKGRNKNVSVEVHVLKKEDDHEKFIQATLKTFTNFRNTNSSCQKDKDKGYYIFYCIRSGKIFDGSYKTSGCGAYTSFKVKEDWLSYKVIVQRTYKEHTGHNTGSEQEGKFQTICPDLVKQIEEWISLGVKPDIVLLEAHNWSRSQGHSDLKNRQYFVTPKDIENIRTCMQRRSHLDKDDAISSTKLLTGPCKENVIFFQPFCPGNELIIILQTPNMRENLHRHGKNIIFLDATHCVNQYNFPLFTLAIRDDYGHGVPVAYIIASSEKQETLELALQKLRHTFPAPPRCFMVDKDICEINALRKIFPESDVLLCWYHVMQAVVRWLSKLHSGVCGPSNSDVRREIIHFFSKMKICATRHEFEETAEQFLKRFEDFPALCCYFKDHWLTTGDMWADYGRCYNHGDSDTNNLVERFFHRLKYQFLGGIRNRRLDDLLNILLKKTEGYFTIIHDLQAVGRIRSAPLKSDEILKSASRLLEKGWADRIKLISQEIYLYDVPSEQISGISYKVCPSESFCSCLVGIRGRLCKHLALLGLLSEHDAQKFPDLNSQMYAHVRAIRQKKLYSVLCTDKKEVEVQSLCNDRVYHTSATTFLCTCCKYSYSENCACLLLACELFDVTMTTSTHTVSQDNTLFQFNENTAHGTATELQKLNEILQTVQKWQTIPEHITKKIEDLHDTVTTASRAECAVLVVTDNLARKIKPLFPHRAKNMKRKYTKHAHKPKN